MTEHELTVLKGAREAMAAFRSTFSCELRLDTLAEVYVANRLQLTMVLGNNPGFDATAVNGARYQIKHRAKNNIVDINSFDFEYLVLITMDEDYLPTNIYRITRAKAESIFVKREKHRRWQASQQKIIALADRIALE